METGQKFDPSLASRPISTDLEVGEAKVMLWGKKVEENADNSMEKKISYQIYQHSVKLKRWHL